MSPLQWKAPNGRWSIFSWNAAKARRLCITTPCRNSRPEHSALTPIILTRLNHKNWLDEQKVAKSWRLRNSFGTKHRAVSLPFNQIKSWNYNSILFSSRKSLYPHYGHGNPRLSHCLLCGGLICAIHANSTLHSLKLSGVHGVLSLQMSEISSNEGLHQSRLIPMRPTPAADW